MTPSPSDKLEGLDGAPGLEAAADAVREPPSVPHPASMVEIVARIIYAAMREAEGDEPWPSFDEQSYNRGNAYFHAANKFARSAIQALREPDLSMLHAAQSASRVLPPEQRPLTVTREYHDANIVWQAMIDEALKE